MLLRQFFKKRQKSIFIFFFSPIVIFLSFGTSQVSRAQLPGAYNWGEYDGSGYIDAVDLDGLKYYLEASDDSGWMTVVPSSDIMDIDGSGFVDAGDLDILKEWLANSSFTTNHPGIPAHLHIDSPDALEIRSGDSVAITAYATEQFDSVMRTGWGVVFEITGGSCLGASLYGRNPSSGDEYIYGNKVFEYTKAPDDFIAPSRALVRVVAPSSCANNQTIEVKVFIPNDESAGLAGRATLGRMPATIVADTLVIKVDNLAGQPQDPSLEFNFAPSLGTNRVLVILANFKDTVPKYSPSIFQNMLFGDSAGTMRDYFREVSYGKLDLQGDIVGWFNVSKEHNYYTNYGDGTRGLVSLTYPKNLAGFAEEAIDLAEQNGVDFSKYDNDRDGWVDSLMIIHQGQSYQMTQDARNLNSDNWSLSYGRASPRFYDNVKIEYFINIAEEDLFRQGEPSIGPYCAQYAIAMGMNELYNFFSFPKLTGLGVYDPLSAGAYGCNSAPCPWPPSGPPFIPFHLSVYNKILAGWLEPVLIDSDTSFTLPAVEQEPVAIKISASSDNSGEYFLLSNRQSFGYDNNLPSRGLFVWHIDEKAFMGNADPAPQTSCDRTTIYYHPTIALEQADGRFDLDTGANQGDTTDAYPLSNTTSFGSATIPSSFNYSCFPSGVKLELIQEYGNTVSGQIRLNDFQRNLTSPELLLKDYRFISSDGDENLEQGETVEVRVVILNTGTPASGIEATIDHNSSYITVTKANASYPFLAQGASAELSFGLKVGNKIPREYKLFLYLTITSNSSSYSVKHNLDFFLGTPKILLIDDDGKGGTERHFIRWLDQHGYFYRYWEVEKKGIPTQAYINSFPYVLWLTGKVIENPLTADELNLIKNYVNSGGKLVLSSAYLLLNPTDPVKEFASNYLKLKSYSDNHYVQYIFGNQQDTLGYNIPSRKLNVLPYYPLFSRNSALIPLESELGSRVGISFSNHFGNPVLIHFAERNGSQIIYSSFGLEHLDRVILSGDYVTLDLLSRLFNPLPYQPGQASISWTEMSNGGSSRVKVKANPNSLGFEFSVFGLNFSPSTNFSFPGGEIILKNKTYVSPNQYKLKVDVLKKAKHGYHQIQLQNPDKDPLTFDSYFMVEGPPLPNVPPVAIAYGDTNTSRWQTHYLDGSASYDPDYDQLTYKWQQLSGPNVTLLPNDSSAQVSFTPSPNYAGQYLFKLTVTDEPGATSSTTVSITIINQPPVAVAYGDTGTSRWQTHHLDGSLSYEPENEPITYNWTQLLGPAVSLEPANNSPFVSFTPSPNYAGLYVFKLEVSDGVTIDSDTVSITIINTPPLADAGADQIVLIEGDTTMVYLDGSASYDADPGDILEYVWTQFYGSPVDLLPSNNSIAPRFTPTAEGLYKFQLAVYDGVAWDSDSVEIQVSFGENHPPLAIARPDELSVEWENSEPVCLDGSSSYDPEGKPISYFWHIEQKPVGSSAQLIPSDNAVSPCFYDDRWGEYIISLRVYDGFFFSARDYVYVHSIKIDNDDDGIPDNVDPDDDNDFMTDSFEQTYQNCGLDPFDPSDGFLILDSRTDPDGDGLANLHEFFNGSNPCIYESWLYLLSGNMEPWGGFFNDADGSGYIDAQDYEALQMFLYYGFTDGYANIFPPESPDVHDLDGDGLITENDLTILTDLLGGSTVPVAGSPSYIELLEPLPGATVRLNQPIRIMAQVLSEYGIPRSGVAVVFELIQGSAILLGGDGETPAKRLLKNLSELNSGSAELSPSLSDDEREIFFSSSRSGNYEIYYSSRGSLEDTFFSPLPVAELNSDSTESGTSLLDIQGERYLYFHRCNLSRTDCNLYYSQWDYANFQFLPPQPITELQGFGSYCREISPVLTRDGLTIFFSTDWDTNYNIYRSTRDDLYSFFTTPQPVLELNTDENEYYPFISSDGFMILFRRIDDLWTSLWNENMESFETPKPLEFVNSPKIETSPFISQDGLRLYFSTNNYSQSFDLYCLSRPSTSLPFYINQTKGRFDLTGTIGWSQSQNSEGIAVMYILPTNANQTIKLVISAPGNPTRGIGACALNMVLELYVVP